MSRKTISGGAVVMRRSADGPVAFDVHVMPEHAQEHRDAGGRVGVVVHDEDGSPARGRRKGSGFGQQGGLDIEPQARQRDRECRALADALALAPDRPAVQDDDALGEREADAEPALGAVERALALGEEVEDALEELRRDAQAVCRSRARCSPRLAAHVDLDAPALRRVLGRVC
jgi:hypothetical protein